MVDTSPGEQFEIHVLSLLSKWIKIAREIVAGQRRAWQARKWKRTSRNSRLLVVPSVDPRLEKFVFVKTDDGGAEGPLLGHADVKLCSMVETISHRYAETQK